MSSESLFDRFQHLFVGRTATDEPDLDPVVEEDAKMRQARRADADAAEATHFVQEYRRWLDMQIDAAEPDPDKGTESAAGRGLVQSTYRKCLRRLDEQLRLARE